ncbi:MAG: hypothetical protein IJX78_05055 [Bacilli bacterium]|nr:hypothetical protein [Bacilli bacterium]
MEKKFNELMQSAIELSKIEKFEREVNYRAFELEITKMASSHKINEEVESFLVSKIESSYKTDKKLAFVLFFVLFTMCRRQNYGDILELVREYDDLFREYEIIRHITLMAVLVKSTDASTIYKAIKNGTKLVSMKNDLCDFTSHSGVLNAYSELICKYFEFQLDEKNEPENIEYLKIGLQCINKAIDLEIKDKGSKEKVYSKFYLNRGRLLILLGKYSKGEADIVKSIELLPLSADRESKVTEYNQYLVKASIIHAYDLNEEKVQDLDKIKVSNYKSIALMTTLLGFLLGAINIFTTVESTYTLGMLMLCYLGLLLILVGTILLGFTLNFKERKKRLYLYDIALIVVGIVIFVFTMILINK